MSRKSDTLIPIAYVVDEASAYLSSLRAKWHINTDAKFGDAVLVDVGHDYRLPDAVEAIKRRSEELGVRLHFATNRHLEAFAASEAWGKRATVVAFGSFVEHPDEGRQVAVLIVSLTYHPVDKAEVAGPKGGNYTSVELVTAAGLWSKDVKVLCIQE